MGIVVEERRSELPGGFCYVRIDFQDGHVRVFDNNFKSVTCCYYAGIERIEEDHPKGRSAVEHPTTRKRLPK